MLKLSGKTIEIKEIKNSGGIFSVSTDKNLPDVLRSKKIFFITENQIPSNYYHYFVTESNQALLQELPRNVNYTILTDDFNYLDNNDIVRLSSDHKAIAVLYRASSPHNSFLVTEQCNHYCLMCSQPPKDIDDSYLLDEIEEAIPLIPKNTFEIGFTGGEPTLHGDRFIKLLNLTKSYLPDTAIHILSNGRKFIDISFAKKYAAIDHPNMMVGIPIYSDDPTLHDYIVQAEGAFDETMLGIINLKRLKQKVEIRVVLHKLSIKRLVELAQFITRNLLFVDHVALMGLEMMGFTRANIDELWIDQSEYKDKLSSAVKILEKSGINISIYNHQLCLINHDILPYYRKSISDWKNEYASECKDCKKINECGGFFASGIKYKYSQNLKPFS
jgi:His-Xaa-Ser system radical SAM maturase HxsC